MKCSYLIAIFALLAIFSIITAQENAADSANTRPLSVSQEEPLLQQGFVKPSEVPTSQISQAPTPPTSAEASTETPDGLIYYGGYPYAPYYGYPIAYRKNAAKRQDVPASEVSHAVPSADGSSAGPDGLIYYGGAPYAPFYGAIPYYGNPWVYKRQAPKASPINVPAAQVSQAPTPPTSAEGSTETPDGLIYYGGYPYAPYYGYGYPYIYKKNAAKKQEVPVEAAPASGSDAGPDGLIYYGGAPYAPFYGAIPYYGNPWVYKRQAPQVPISNVPAAEVSQAPIPPASAEGSTETPDGLIYYGGLPYAPYYAGYGFGAVYGKKQAS